MNVRYHAEAVEEYDYAVRYYSAISPPLAASLIEEVEHCIERIAAHPFQGRELRPLIRAMRVNISPYHLVYMVDRDASTILAVAHDKREPDYWIHRAN